MSSWIRVLAMSTSCAVACCSSASIESDHPSQFSARVNKLLIVADMGSTLPRHGRRGEDTLSTDLISYLKGCGIDAQYVDGDLAHPDQALKSTARNFGPDAVLQISGSLGKFQIPPYVTAINDAYTLAIYDVKARRLVWKAFANFSPGMAAVQILADAITNKLSKDAVFGSACTRRSGGRT